MEEMSGAEPPCFEIGQAVLVDQGLPAEITSVERGIQRFGGGSIRSRLRGTLFG
jgi:hypothetical protein